MNTTTKRKQSHLNVCQHFGNSISGAQSAGFDQIRFFHKALPELIYDEIATDTTFLNCPLKLPLFISCMTGGTDQGRTANRELAKAAEKAKIPLGLGSCRVLFEHPERFDDFHMRQLAPTIPILANLGAVQLKKMDSKKVSELIKRLEVNALVIHLNAGQELFQAGGDKDFRGLLETLSTFKCDVPLIVKETGFGISKTLVAELLDRGVSFVDVAGAGGTNWILVEGVSHNDPSAEEFADWGFPTAPLLDALKHHSGKILASGGLRSGMDLAKSLALKAELGGMALPFIQAALEGGAEQVGVMIETIQNTLRKVMLLTGSKTIDDLRQAPLIRSSTHQHFVEEISR